MKKLILLLVISLGLSVANAESVCSSYSVKDRKASDKNRYSSIAEAISYFATGSNRATDYWDKLIMRYYNAEIKKSDKETICVYMFTVGKDYLNIELTPQEIERFERFLVEKGVYRKYDGDKEDFLKVLKFFKYYNKLNVLYNKKDIKLEWNDIYRIPKDNNNLYMLKTLLLGNSNINEDYDVLLAIKKFIYGKNVGDYLPNLFGGESLYSLAELKVGDYRNNQDVIDIVQWAESRLKKSKSKEAK